MPANFFKKTSLSRNILLKITLQRNNENQHASLDSSLIQQRMVGSVKNIFMLPALSYYDFSLRLSDNHLLSSNFFFGISLTLQTLCNRVAAAKWTSTTRKTLVWTYTTALKRAKTMLTSRKNHQRKKLWKLRSVYRDFSGWKTYIFLTTPASKTILLYSWSNIISDSVKEKFTSFRMNKQKYLQYFTHHH